MMGGAGCSSDRPSWNWSSGLLHGSARVADAHAPPPAAACPGDSAEPQPTRGLIGWVGLMRACIYNVHAHFHACKHGHARDILGVALHGKLRTNSYGK
mmetsp:Transcript_38532/g.114362  ORF Transcript_38532/g.114362 Transcript_38532/m.114362 type:complete len:98 (+) Transcript_38532:929-1222(+)